MKIAFSKIRFQEIPFEVKKEGLTFSGSLQSERKNLVKLTACLEADIERVCDRCGEPMTVHYKEDLDLLVSEGLYEGTNELDVIESLGDFVDLDEIIESEVNLLKSDYVYCNSCQS